MSSNSDDKGPRSHRTEIIVAVISLAGVLGGALFANWDKIFPPGPVEPPPVGTGTTTPISPPTQPPTPGTFVESFVGHWENENAATDGITRVDISSRLDKVYVHMWGKCHPADCDWGTESTSRADSDDGVLSITWRTSFKVTDQEIAILPDGRLRVYGNTRFTDNSGRPAYDSTHFFTKR